jgi:hypothetical protein
VVEQIFGSHPTSAQLLSVASVVLRRLPIPTPLVGPPSHLGSTAAPSPSALARPRRWKNSATPPAPIVSTAWPPHGGNLMDEGMGSLAGRANRFLGPTRHRLCSSRVASVISRTDSHLHRPPNAAAFSVVPSDARRIVSEHNLRSATSGDSNTNLGFKIGSKVLLTQAVAEEQCNDFNVDSVYSYAPYDPDPEDPAPAATPRHEPGI